MKLLLTTVSALCCLNIPVMAAPLSEQAKDAQRAARAYGAAIRNCDMAWVLDSMYPPLLNSMADQMAGEGESAEADRAKRIMGMQEETAQQAQQRRNTGYQKLREKYTRMGKELQASGFRVESFTVGTPTAEYVVAPPVDVINKVRSDKGGKVKVENLKDGQGRSRIVILPTSLVCSAPDGRGKTVRIRRDSFIYAVRDEVRPEQDTGNGTKLNKWYFIDGNTSITQIRAFFPKLPVNIKIPPCGDKVLN